MYSGRGDMLLHEDDLPFLCLLVMFLHSDPVASRFLLHVSLGETCYVSCMLYICVIYVIYTYMRRNMCHGTCYVSDLLIRCHLCGNCRSLWVADLTSVMLASGFGMAVYFVPLLCFRIPETDDVFNLLQAKL